MKEIKAVVGTNSWGKAANVQLLPKEIEFLEMIADQCGAKVLGADNFRFAVKK